MNGKQDVSQINADRGPLVGLGERIFLEVDVRNLVADPEIDGGYLVTVRHQGASDCWQYFSTGLKKLRVLTDDGRLAMVKA